MNPKDEEFDKQFQTATRRGDERLSKEPRASAARYDAESERIIVELTNGCVFMFPARLVQGLADASPEELAEIEVAPYGFALHWKRLNADATVPGLMAGIFGTKAWMAEIGRRGGAVTSEAKRAAVRENGKKGGRPPRSTATTNKRARA